MEIHKLIRAVKELTWQAREKTGRFLHALSNSIASGIATTSSYIKARRIAQERQQPVKQKKDVLAPRRPLVPEVEPDFVRKLITFSTVFAGVFIVVLLFCFMLWVSFFETQNFKLSVLGIDALWLVGIFLLLQGIPFFSYSLFMKKEKGDIVLVVANIFYLISSIVFLLWLIVTLLFANVKFI